MKLPFTFTKLNLHKLPLSKIVAVGAIIWAIMATKSCNLAKVELSSSKGIYIELYQKQAKEFTIERNAEKQEVATQIELVEKARGEAASLKAELLRKSLLKDITRNATVETVNNMSGINASFIQPEVSLPKPTISVGQQFLDSNKWYTIKGTILNDRVRFDSLYFKNALTINYGLKKDKGLIGYFKKPKSVVEVINESPYAKTTEIKNITFKQKRIKPIVYFGAGIVAGVIAVHYINK